MGKRRGFVAGSIGVLVAVTIGTLPAQAVPSSPDRLTHAHPSGDTDGFSMNPYVSGNGRYVAFTSDATNLTSSTSLSGWHAYVHDRDTGQTRLASADDYGTPGNDQSFAKGVTNDGAVLFESYADNLVSNDGNAAWDVFVREWGGSTSRVSKSSGGTEGNDASYGSSISADGDRVLFWSFASNLATGSSGAASLYVRDRSAGDTSVIVNFANAPYENRMLISGDGETVVFETGATLATTDTDSEIDVYTHEVGSIGYVHVSDLLSGQGLHAQQPYISYSGRYVVYVGDGLLTADATSQSLDVYLHDATNDTTDIVSLSSSGTQQYEWGGGGMPSVSNDGQYVSFQSSAELVPAADNCCGVHVYLRDTVNDTTTRLNEPSPGYDSDASAEQQMVSGDGSVVVFMSFASDLGAYDGNGLPDIFEVTL
jgi:hypothetical protein